MPYTLCKVVILHYFGSMRSRVSCESFTDGSACVATNPLPRNCASAASRALLGIGSRFAFQGLALVSSFARPAWVSRFSQPRRFAWLCNGRARPALHVLVVALRSPQPIPSANT
jgi:hypothetical protein